MKKVSLSCEIGGVIKCWYDHESCFKYIYNFVFDSRPNWDLFFVNFGPCFSLQNIIFEPIKNLH